MISIGELIREEGMEKYTRKPRTYNPFAVPEETGERFRFIKHAYDENMDWLLECYPGMDPYIIDWNKVFSPIELPVWDYIRMMGLPYLPQFPVGNRFLDFADPIRKIDIECDGKQWHDEESDKKRDAELEAQGWKIYRLSGEMIFLDSKNEEIWDYHLDCEMYDTSHTGVMRYPDKMMRRCTLNQFMVELRLEYYEYRRLLREQRNRESLIDSAQAMFN